MKSNFNVADGSDNREIEFKQFAGGEWNVSVSGGFFKNEIFISADIRDGDVMKLAILKDAVDRLNVKRNKIVLSMPYLPYARQDRVMVVGESLSLKVFCNIINSLKFDEVILADPHSDVGTALLENVSWDEQWCWAYTNSEEYDAIVSPDAGALKKIYKQAKNANIPVIEAMKTRDIQTGIVSEPRFSADVTDKKLLIVDDIIDAGRSFIGLGKALKEAGATRVDLFATHGIFSYNAKENLAQYIDNVYTRFDWTK